MTKLQVIATIYSPCSIPINKISHILQFRVAVGDGVDGRGDEVGELGRRVMPGRNRQLLPPGVARTPGCQREESDVSDLKLLPFVLDDRHQDIVDLRGSVEEKSLNFF